MKHKMYQSYYLHKEKQLHSQSSISFKSAETIDAESNQHDRAFGPRTIKESATNLKKRAVLIVTKTENKSLESLGDVSVKIFIRDRRVAGRQRLECEQAISR